MAFKNGELDWNGREIEARINRAIGRGTIGVGEGVVNFGKQYVDVISGDLMRSIHLAVPRTLGEQEATQFNIITDDGAVVDAGSWLDYACVEEVGRGHAFMQPAIESVRPFTVATFTEAFKQEGF